MGFISRGTPGMQATNLPSARTATKPGAVPFGLSSTIEPTGRIAWRRLFSLSGPLRPKATKRASIARRDGSCNSSVVPTAEATASLVRSSTVGPRPPVAMTPSLRSKASRNNASRRRALSPTECLRYTSTPWSAKTRAMWTELVSTKCPSKSSVPMVTISTLAMCCSAACRQ